MNKLKNFIRFLRFFTCLPISSILSIIIIGTIFKESKNHEFHLRELIGSFVWFTSVNLVSPSLTNKKEQLILISFFSLMVIFHSLMGIFQLGYLTNYYSNLYRISLCFSGIILSLPLLLLIKRVKLIN